MIHILKAFFSPPSFLGPVSSVAVLPPHMTEGTRFARVIPKIHHPANHRAWMAIAYCLEQSSATSASKLAPLVEAARSDLAAPPLGNHGENKSMPGVNP